jgi:ubiquinone/menaquinone biosynthesis C-methylase UbiE
MSFQRISKLSFVREFLCQLAAWRVAEKLNELTPHLKSKDNVLDVGSGNGILCYELRKRGFSVTALDVRNLSFIDNIKPAIYDGLKMPLRDVSVDVLLLITVLHHTQSPERVLGEAKRVAKKIIVIEETYSNIINKYLTYFIDSVFNFEFFGHPHTNKTDADWRDLFERLGLKLAHARYSRSIFVLRRVTYVLENDGLEHKDKRKNAA